MTNNKNKIEVLDMKNYQVEKLLSKEKTTFEKWMALIGGLLAILVFILLH